jgi:hypothetical protein
LILSDAGELKRLLTDKLGKNAYGWFDQKTRIEKTIREYAEEKYRNGYFETVLKKIDMLDAKQAKVYLKELIKNEPLVGIKIMKNN